MNFTIIGRSKAQQSQLGLLSWPTLILIGVFLAPQQIEAREWEFNLPLREISTSPADGQIQGPFIHTDKGDSITIHIINNTPFKHTIRWHGTHQADRRNSNMLKMTKRFLSIQETIEAGENFTYRWKAEKTGTFWHHCHVNPSKQVGMSARQTMSSYQVDNTFR
ncbi:MAG: multicopper oxidase domain-containing protein [Candidatus Nitrosoglobus sp.]|jgi:FtsP/CotA-like multicopper oxidase with cupredoxin domain